MNRRCFKAIVVQGVLSLCSTAVYGATIQDFSPDYSEPALTDSERQQIFPQAPDADYSEQARLLRLNAALAKHPKTTTLLARRAVVLADLSKFGPALQDIDEAIKAHPERDPYYWDCAQIYMQSKNYDAALEDCKTARRLTSPSRRWISDWIRAEIFKSMGKKEDSMLAARTALDSMANCGFTNENLLNQVKALLNEQKYEPVKRLDGRDRIIGAISDLCKESSPPSDSRLAEILGLSQADLKTPLVAPNESLYVLTRDDTPWLKIKKVMIGDAHQYRGLTVEIDSDKCSLNEQDLKHAFGARESEMDLGLKSGAGLEKSLNCSYEHCRLAFVLQPGGYRSLTNVDITW